jgi:peptidoglycan hydrolase-like protein with peptidoglycan-binding domain
MPNPGQPTITAGATGDSVRRLQRALRRTPNPSLVVDGVFGPTTETAVKQFQQGAGLVTDGDLAGRVDRQCRSQPAAGAYERCIRAVEYDPERG